MVQDRGDGPTDEGKQVYQRREEVRLGYNAARRLSRSTRGSRRAE